MENNNIQDNQHNVLFLVILTILTITLNAENSIYMQFFSELTKYYNVNIDETGYILRLGFIGSFIFVIFVGPLADCYGRKKIFIGGVSLYIISNLACFFAKSFDVFLFWRFFDGVARSIPIIVGWLMVFDKNPITKSSKQVSFVQGTASLIVICIPIFSVDVSKFIGWHDILLFSSILAFIALIIIVVSVQETLPSEQRKKFNLKEICNNYWKLLKNLEFITYTLIYGFSMMNYNVFFSNASIVFVDHLGLTREAFSYYQTLNSIVYIVFSFLAVKLIATKGIDYTKNLGLFIFIVGCTAVMVVSVANDDNIEAIFATVIITAAGAAFMSGFMLKAVNMFPEIRGTAMALSTSIGLVISARASFWAQKFFNDTILPAVIVIFICSIISLSLFILLRFKKKEA